MKRAISFLLVLAVLLTLSGCQGNFGKVNLQEAIPIPADGIIRQGTLQQIRNENAIGSFFGQSNGFPYEWTIFGSDIREAKQINLQVDVTRTLGGDIRIALGQQEEFGFSGLLSVYVDEQWNAQSATAYREENPVASVSLTGNDQTILNLSLDGTVREFVIRPDPMPEEALQTEETVAEQTETATEETVNDDYLSAMEEYDDQVYTDGKDKYLTDPIPAGKPKPVEPEDQQVNKGKTYTCTFSIECSTILNNLDMLEPDKLEMVPSGGTILAKTTVTFYEGESVFDVLQRLCREKGIHLESSWTPIYNSAYIEGIHNLYEFDCGSLSGWMYRVNGWYPNYGCSRYQLQDGDVVEWRYTCDLGEDVGRNGSW